MVSRRINPYTKYEKRDFTKLMTEQINNRYQLKNVLGTGGMGVVYRAYDRLTDTFVALKRVQPGVKSPEHSTQALTPLSLANEFRTLATLRHPHIISVLDYGFDTESAPYFTMTLLEEKQEFLDALGDSSIDEQVFFFNQMFLALVYLHQRGIVHCDMKPGNVLISQKQLKVLDFGLAVSIKNNRDRAGTIHYMAPETLAKGVVHNTSDLYSSGVMMYQVITGKMPYRPADIQRRIEYPISMRHMKGHPLEAVVQRLLQIKPEDRYQSADEVIKAINEATHHTPVAETEAIVESFLQTAPFVGREQEIEALENALTESSSSSSSSMWLVGGESGVGKSRLVEELRVRALVSGRLVIQGQAAQRENLPFEQWRSIVRRLCLSAELNDWTAGVIKDLVPDIDSLLNRDIVPAPQMMGQGYQERLAIAIETLIRQQATPLLLIFEDLQWADEGLALVKHMVSIIDTLPDVMMIGTYREDEAPELLEQLPRANYLRLNRLDEDAIVELSAAMLGDAGKQSQVIDLMKRETDGNIFFMVEVARTLTEEAGSLSDIGRTTLPKQVFTGMMQGILNKRVQKLATVHQAVLHFAAIYGRQLNLDLLRDVFSEEAVQNFLYACETLSILITRDEQWLFIHDKIRDAILDNLSDGEKVGIHKQVAIAIEKLYPEDKGHDEILLEHWHLAGDLSNEITYLNKVAQNLIIITGEYEKARRLITRTLSLLSEDDVNQISLLNYLAESHWESGNIREAENIAGQALPLAIKHEILAGQAESHILLARAKRIHDDIEDALSHAKVALELFQQLDIKRGISFSLYVLGNTYARTGDYQSAGEYFEQSLELARELNEFRIMGLCLEELGMVMRVRRNIEQAIIYTEESLELSQKLGDKRGIALKLNSLGRVLRDNGQYKLAEEKLAESLRLLEELNDSFGVAWSAYNLGLLLQIHGNYNYASSLTSDSLKTYEALDDNYGIAICVNSLGFINLAIDKHDEAIPQFCRAIDIGKAKGIPALALIAVVGLAIILHQRGETARVSQLLQLANQHPSTNTEVYFRLATLPVEVETIQSRIADNSELVDYEETIDSLLKEFTSEIE